MALTREQIFAAQDAKVQEVPVPEWGGSVFMRVMSAKQRESWETELIDNKYKGHVRTGLLVRTICDEAGKELFAYADIEALGLKDSSVIDALFDKARVINKLTKEDTDNLKNASTPTP